VLKSANIAMKYNVKSAGNRYEFLVYGYEAEPNQEGVLSHDSELPHISERGVPHFQADSLSYLSCIL
jgi:hypothetical protein